MSIRDVQQMVLLLAVDGESPENARDLLKREETTLHLRPEGWLVEPPYFVDEVDEFDCLTVGYALHTPDPTASGFAPLTPAEEWRLFDETFALVEFVRRISREHRIDFVAELRGEVIGGIDAGALDSSLQAGFIDAWRKSLPPREGDGSSS